MSSVRRGDNLPAQSLSVRLVCVVTQVKGAATESHLWLLDLAGIIVAHADHKRRVLIGWPTASRDGEAIAGGDAGMWVDAEAVEPAGR